MTLDVIRTLYAYDQWATERIFTAAEGLTAEELNTPGTAGHGSIRETLLHQISAHWNWLGWWTGRLSAEESMTSRLDPVDYPDLASVREIWEQTVAQTHTFLDGLTEADTQREYTATLPWGGQTVTYTLWQMMTHVANHGTQHRSEAAAMLTAVSHSPGYLDMIFFLTELQAVALP